MQRTVDAMMPAKQFFHTVIRIVFFVINSSAQAFFGGFMTLEQRSESNAISQS
jgi:hypothetical protein